MEGSAPAALDPSAQERHARRALSDAKRHLQRSTLKLAGYLVVAYLVLKLIPALKQALPSLEHVSWEWALGAVALEVLSELGFVVAWSGIVVGAWILHRFEMPTKVIAEREFNLSFLNTTIDARLPRHPRPPGPRVRGRGDGVHHRGAGRIDSPAGQHRDDRRDRRDADRLQDSHNAAIAAVLLHQAVGLLVPLAGV